MGAYLGPKEELKSWVKSKVETWDHRVITLSKIVKRHPQSAFFGLVISLKLKWHYVQRTVSIVGTLIGPIEEALRENPPPVLFGGKEVNSDFRKILGHSVKPGRLSIPSPQLSAESAYNTYKASSGKLVGSLLGSTTLNYVDHRDCVRRESKRARKEWQYVYMSELGILKELTGVQERKRLHRLTNNEVWLSAIPRRLNGT